MDGRVKPGHDEREVRYEEAQWPEAEFIVGNPPFLGSQLMRNGLGDEYVRTLSKIFENRLTSSVDLVVYWFEKARIQLENKQSKRIGLVATNSIRGASNRRVLDRILEQTNIFEAWSDEPWVVDGAAVRVSIVCFGSEQNFARLDGHQVPLIHSDLSGGTLNLTSTKRLRDNADVWPAPGSEDTELGVLMGPEVRHGEAEVYARVQA